jgi:hypothetical protein
LHERLIEFWLDSASERIYQPAFLQMLVADGHRILHSTRHGPLEFGKDVVTVAADGVPCAYQLKGNPGGRLNRPQFRDMLEQLQELVGAAIPYPGAPPIRHRSYLVTNGLVEEDVQLLIGQMNKNWERMGYGPEALRVISRGELLDMALRTGTALWPFSFAGIEGLVAMLAHRGDTMLPIEKVHALLTDVLCLTPNSEAPKAADLERRLSSAAVLLSVSLRNFSGAANHYAVSSAWTIFFAYAVAAYERRSMQPSTRLNEVLRIARSASLDALADLADEACSRSAMSEGNRWSDNEFIHARRTLVLSLISVLWLRCRIEKMRPPQIGNWERQLPATFPPRSLWGEAAIPQMLALYWTFSIRDGGNTAERDLGNLLELVVGAQVGKAHIEPLAQPYYGIEDVVRHKYAGLLPEHPDPLEDDKARGISFSATALLHLVVRANLKQTCKTIWPDYTRLAHRTFDPAEPWQFCLFRASEGNDNEVMVQSRGIWSELQAQAADCSTQGVPALLTSDPIMLLLFIIAVPQRATPSVVRYLGSRFSHIWFLPHAKPSISTQAT